MATCSTDDAKVDIVGLTKSLCLGVGGEVGLFNCLLLCGPWLDSESEI